VLAPHVVAVTLAEGLGLFNIRDDGPPTLPDVDPLDELPINIPLARRPYALVEVPVDWLRYGPVIRTNR
jgi:hypothetical protein